MTIRRKRAALLSLLLLASIILFAAVSLWSCQRQEALNRQLIAALVKGDAQQALVLVNAGADPNTLYNPSSRPSLGQLWDWLVHRAALPPNDTRSAFLLACGACWHDNNPAFTGIDADAPHLVETMLHHGANKNAKDVMGCTTLIWSVRVDHPKTAGILLHSGTDVNAQDQQGRSALHLSAIFASDHTARIDLIRQLLAHGANPNLPDNYGLTPLQYAQEFSGLQARALLRRAGAKK